MAKKSEDKDLDQPEVKDEKPMTEAEKQDSANPTIPVGKPEPMKELGPGHTYEDRVKAQAESLGIVVPEGSTTTYIAWLIQMKASS